MNYLERKEPQKNNVAILGPENTYSHLALKHFDSKAHPYFSTSIYEVFKLVENGKVKAGLVPLENTIGGSVRETLDGLYENNVHIEQVMELPIRLALVSQKKLSLKKLKAIYSHPQPLLQARKFLEKYCPQARLIATSSTTEAMERILKEESVAAVASAEAAQERQLRILKNSIESGSHNLTYFAFIKKGPAKLKKGAKKTSIAFHFKKDSPGSLVSVLQTFAEAKINLSKIESRRNLQLKGDYVFFVDFEASAASKKAHVVLEEIKTKFAKMKVLGSY